MKPHLAESVVGRICRWYFRQVVTGLQATFAPLMKAYLSVGDYLKTKRAMIRAVEKQALLSEKIDLLKEALAEGGVTSVAGEGAQPKPAPSPGKCFSRMQPFPFILAGYSGPLLGVP